MRKALVLVALTAALARAASAQNLEALWGSSANDVWALGPGVGLHFDGQAWSYHPVPVDVQDIQGMDGSGANNIWAFGLRRGGTSVLYHWDGTQWAAVTLPPGESAVSAVAVSPTSVFVLGEGSDEAAPAALHIWDGRTWTRERLPHALVVAGMRLVGNELWIAGYVYNDPRPDTRNQYGVVLRRVAGRWVSTWVGRRSSDPLIGAASWSRIDVAAGRVLLFGQTSTGTKHLLVRRGGAWQRVAEPAMPAGASEIVHAFLLGDGSLVLNYYPGSGSVLLRQRGAAWEPMAATVIPTLPVGATLDRGFTNWSPPGADHSYTVVGPRMVGILSTTGTRVLAASWCLGAPGGSGVRASPDAAVCTVLGGAATAAPAASAAPSAPAAPGAKPPGKGRTPPSGLPMPARP